MDEKTAYEWAAECLKPIEKLVEPHKLQQAADKVAAAILEAAKLAEVERLRDALREMMEFNPLRNDRDAYLLALAEWGLKGKWGVDEEFTERPQRAVFGLDR